MIFPGDFFFQHTYDYDSPKIINTARISRSKPHEKINNAADNVNFDIYSSMINLTNEFVMQKKKKKKKKKGSRLRRIQHNTAKI